jgi:hypothetical protein
MNGRITDHTELIDHKTSRSICDGVGEQLQRRLSRESAQLPPQLERLMDELRRRDSEDRQEAAH